MQDLLTNFILIIFIFISSFFLFYIPGKIINIKILKEENDFIISFILGFSLFTFISFFIYEIQFRVFQTIIIYFVYIFIFSFIFYFKKIGKIIFRFPSLKKNWIFFFSAFFLLILLFLIRPIYLENDGSDMWYYLAIIRSFLDDGYFSNTTPWFNTKQSSYPSNSFFLYLTMIKYIFYKVSLFDILRLVGVFLTVLTIFINAKVLDVFVKNLKHSLSIIIVIFAISFILRDNLIYFMTSLPYYPKIFSSLIFIPTLIYIFFTQKYKKKLFPYFLTIIFIAYINQSSINIVIAGILIFAFLILELEKAIFINKLIKLLFPLIIVVLFGYFYLSGFYFEKDGVISTYSNDLSINAKSEGPYYGQISEIFEGIYIYNPIKYFLGLKSFYLLIIFLTFFSLRSIRDNNLIIYFYSMLIISFLIVFNPISIFILNKLLPINFLVRINWIFVGYIFLGSLIYQIIQKFSFKDNVYKYFLIFSSLIFILLSNAYYKKYDNTYLISIKELENYLNDIKIGSFIVTDKYTSNKLLALKKHKFLISHEAWLNSSTPSLNFEKYENIYNDANLITNKNVIRYLSDLNADYLLVNKKKSTNYNLIDSYKNIKIIFENNLFILIEI